MGKHTYTHTHTLTHTHHTTHTQTHVDRCTNVDRGAAGLNNMQMVIITKNTHQHTHTHTHTQTHYHTQKTNTKSYFQLSNKSQNNMQPDTCGTHMPAKPLHYSTVYFP